MNDQAFYNEIDKDAAAWLRELIAEGHIAPGIVDERSIEDVRPDELAGFTQCHFFAGIGIWSLALRAAGIPDDYPIWSGSCPCQPFSSAGKGDGFDDERHLWPAFHHLISQRRPPAVVGEQVASKNAMPWIDLVHTDLEALGYAFGALPFPTAGIGGPHIRDRLYWGAFSAGVTLGDTGSKGLQGHRGYGNHGRQPGWLGAIEAGPVAEAGEFGRLADLSGSGRREECAVLGGRALGDGAQGLAAGLVHGGSADWLADMHSNGRNQAGQHIATTRGDGTSGDGSTGGLGHAIRAGRQPEPHVIGSDAAGMGPAGSFAEQSSQDGAYPSGLAVTRSERHDGRGATGATGATVSGRAAVAGHSPSAFGVADTQLQPGCAEHEPEQGRRATPAAHIAEPWRDGEERRPGPVNGFWRTSDWLYCRDGKWRPVEPGTQPLAHGMPRSMGALPPELQRLAEVAGLSNASLKRAKQYRVGGLRAYGNAINALAAQAFIESLMEQS